MAAVSIDGAVGAGFGLIRRKPLAVLTWGLAQAAGGLVFFGAYAYFLAGFLPFAVASAGGGGGPAADSQTMALMGHMLMGEGFLFLGVLLMLFVRVVVMAASWRAVLRPEQSRWAYLRVGRAEGFILLLLLGLAFAGNIILIPMIPIMLIASLLAAFHQWIAAVIVGIAGFVAMIAAILYVELRFSLIGPMIVDDNKFHFLDAWKLTRGKVGSLFLVGLCIVAILMGVELVIFLLAVGLGVAGLAQAAGGLEHLEGFFQSSPQAIAMALAPLMAIYAIALVPIAGAFTAVIGAPWARAYRDLAAPDASESFA